MVDLISFKGEHLEVTFREGYNVQKKIKILVTNFPLKDWNIPELSLYFVSVLSPRNCSLYLSVREAGGDSGATFVLEDWITEDRLVIWAAQKVQSDTAGDFVGISQKYLQHTLAKIAGNERCRDY